MSFYQGLKLIFHTSVSKNSQLGIEHELALAGKKIPCLVHIPQSAEKGLIISFTGFSMSGYKDNRIAILNNAFAKLGYRVMTPKIESIDSLEINPEAIVDISQVIGKISADETLNPNKFRPAVLAPSFTAGMVSLAIAEMPHHSVSSLCLIGTFCDFESTIEFALTNEENTDDYGMHILMKNFLHHEIGRNESMEKIIQTALEDNGLKRKSPLLPIVLSATETDVLDFYHQLRYNTEFRRKTIMGSWQKIPNFERWKYSLDLSKHAHKITCPITLIHGKSDVVIPSTESVLLHSLLVHHNPNIHLELSELLDHGDLKVGFGIFKSVGNLAKAFGNFLKYVK